MDASEQDYYRVVFEHLGFVCITVDAALRVRRWNRQAAEELLLSPGDEGRPVLEIFEEPERGDVKRIFQHCVDQKTPGEMEIRYRGADEDRSTFILIVSPIINDAGDCVGASASMRDISLRKRLSQELSRSKRMAALGKMAGGVAHHFNNILGGMLASIDSVLASENIQELRRTLRLLASAIGRATRITKQLSAFAESDTEVMQWSQLNPLMETFCERMRRLAEAREIRFAAQIKDVSPTSFEVQRLIPVLESIAQNALDAMQPGGTLTISLHEEAGQAVVTVRDTGCGMTEETKEHLFEPFFTTKGGLGGGATDNIGLGLAAVHGLLAEIDGSIRITSKLGVGTEVQIHLPLERTAAEAAGAHQH